MGNNEINIPNYLISPGYIYLPESQTKISAVLGSCVSITLFDKKIKIGGMNHFLYPEIEKGDSPRSIYGNVAIKTLIKMFLHAGSKRKNIEAQIFGGAFNREISVMDVGKKNIDCAKKILIKERINITSEDTGGNRGRKVIFDTMTNEVVVIRVDKLRQTDWFPYE